VSELENIYEEFKKLLPAGLGETDDVAGIFGIGEVMDFLKSTLFDTSGSFLKMLALFVGVATLLALADVLSAENSNAEVIRSVSAICVSVPLFTVFYDMISEASVGLQSGCELFAGMIPLLCSVAALGGGGATAAASGTSMSFTLSLISGISVRNLFPLAIAVFICSVVSSFDTGQGTRRIARSVRTLFGFVLGASTTLLVSTVALQSIVSSAKDSVALRGARFVINGMIPAVSGTVGATLGTLVSGASVLLSTMGATGVVALAMTVGVPLFRIFTYRFALQLAVAFCGMIGAEHSERFLDSLRSSVDLIISVMASTLLTFVFEMVIFMKTAVPGS
jgi:hypothetical protein